MKKNNKKGFTLVELLAVIVILAIILVIAVPKIMSVIKDAKTGSMESSAKLVAKGIERNYQISLAKGEDGTLSRSGSCISLFDLDTSEYETCTYVIGSDERVTISLTGSSTGKFAGLECIDATSKEASCKAKTTTNVVTLVNTIKNLVGTNTSVTSGTGGLKKYTYDSNNTEVTENITKTDYRYYGSNPNNYIKFSGSDEVWRIIGIVDGKVKVIRNESFKTTDSTILTMSWDSSASTVNNGLGINEWSQADIKNMLNNYYYGTEVNCTYCYDSDQASCTQSCNTYILKMPNTIKNMIDENATWYLGTPNTIDDDFEAISASKAYQNERGTTTGKICTSSDTCNDEVSRNKTWNGAVGLMNLSDYGYAADLTQCPEELVSYDVLDCIDNNWIYKGNENTSQWTISPFVNSDCAYYVWSVDGGGYVTGPSADSFFGVRPTAYLKDNASILSGTGTSTDPYILTQ